MFAFVLKLAFTKKLLKGKTVGVDATTLEANAAMKSIVRRDTGDTYRQYLTKLAKEAGIEEPTDADLQRFDRKRKGKKASNDDWQSPSDPDARITKMKDGTTHLAYKAEHAVDLDTNIVIAATIHSGDAADGETIKETIVDAEIYLQQATGRGDLIEEIAADKGYNKTETLVWAEERELRPTFPSLSTRTAGDGRTNLRTGKPRATARGGDALGRRARRSSARAVSWWSGPSRTFAVQGERDGLGSEAWSRSASAT